MIQDSFAAALNAASLDLGSRIYLKLQGETTSLHVDFSPAPAILPSWLRRGLAPQAKLRLATVTAGDPAVLEAWLVEAKLDWLRVDDNSVIIPWEAQDYALEGKLISDLHQLDRFLREPKHLGVDVPAFAIDQEDAKKPDLAGAGEAMRRMLGKGSERLQERSEDCDEPTSVEVQVGLREIVFVTQGAVPKRVKAFVLDELGDILKVHVPPGQPVPSREYSIKKESLI